MCVHSNGLTARQLSQHQFRKQVELKSYVVDFCCLKERLVIEVDGGQHATIVRALKAPKVEL